MSNTIAPLKTRTYEEINSDRRKILEEAYEEFPSTLENVEGKRFNWETPGTRTALFDLYHLHDAGFVEITAGRDRKTAPPLLIPFLYRITSAGNSLIETPGRIDKEMPIIAISNVGGDVVIGDNNVIRSTIEALTSLKEAAESLAVPYDDKRGLVDHINAVLSHPLLQTALKLFFESNPLKGV